MKIFKLIYDPWGRLTQVNTPEGRTECYYYNGLDQMKSKSVLPFGQKICELVP